MTEPLVVAHNPDPDSNLPYLVRVPIEGGLVLRTREPYPTSARVFCYEAGDPWPRDPKVVESVPVRSCRRRGPAIDLILDRPRLNRSQFIFTQLKGGRPAIFWQTPLTTKKTKPGARMPRRRASGIAELAIVVDTRERYAYKFAGKQATTSNASLTCGDYAVLGESGNVTAAVERKRLEDLVGCLVDGSLQFALADLADLPRAAVVVEGRYGDLLDLEHVQPGWVLELLARLQVRYHMVPIVFAGSRKLAEEYTFRFLGAARVEGGGGPGPQGTTTR